MPARTVGSLILFKEERKQRLIIPGRKGKGRKGGEGVEQQQLDAPTEGGLGHERGGRWNTLIVTVRTSGR